MDTALIQTIITKEQQKVESYKIKSYSEKLNSYILPFGEKWLIRSLKRKTPDLGYNRIFLPGFYPFAI